MAIWKFYFSLIPIQGIMNVYGKIPFTLEGYEPQPSNQELLENHLQQLDENKEYPNYWSGIEIPNYIIDKINKRLPLMKSWSKEANMYGSKDGSRVEIWNDMFYVAVNTLCKDEDLLELFALIAKMLDCKIVFDGNGKMIDPNYLTLKDYYEKSIARKFVENPKETVLNIEKLREEDKQ